MERIPSFLIGVTLGSILTASIFYSTGTHGAPGVVSQGAIIRPFTSDGAMANPIKVSDDNKYMGPPCRFQNLPGRTNWGHIIAWDETQPIGTHVDGTKVPENGFQSFYPDPNKYFCEGFNDDGIPPVLIGDKWVYGDNYRIGHVARQTR
jgi:hypothetical protein